MMAKGEEKIGEEGCLLYFLVLYVLCFTVRKRNGSEELIHQRRARFTDKTELLNLMLLLAFVSSQTS